MFVFLPFNILVKINEAEHGKNAMPAVKTFMSHIHKTQANHYLITIRSN